MYRPERQVIGTVGEHRVSIRTHHAMTGSLGIKAASSCRPDFANERGSAGKRVLAYALLVASFVVDEFLSLVAETSTEEKSIESAPR